MSIMADNWGAGVAVADPVQFFIEPILGELLDGEGRS